MGDAQDRRCTIVMYHYVRNVSETPYPGIHALSVDKFRSQIELLARRYEPVSLDDYVDGLSSGEDAKLPEKGVVLTFDDGLADHYHHVVPVLRTIGIPAAFFIITQTLIECSVPVVHKIHFLISKLGSMSLADEINRAARARHPALADRFFIDDGEKKDPSRKWDDPLTANLKWAVAAMPMAMKTDIVASVFARHFANEREFCKELFLSGAQLTEMRSYGMTIGSHSHSHPMLTEISPEEQAREMAVSRSTLESMLGQPVVHLSYPYGAFAGETAAIARHQGFKSALADTGGANIGLDVDRYALRRIDTNDVES